MNYCWNAIRGFGLGGVKLEKGLADFRVENLMGDIVNFEGGKWCGWTPWSSRL